MVVAITVEEAIPVENHTEYKIVTHVDLVKVSTWRRFRVMDAVFHRLRRKYWDLPTSPAKKFSPMGLPASAIEDRRMQVQEYLRLLLKHPAAKVDPEFRELVGWYKGVRAHGLVMGVRLLNEKNENITRRTVWGFWLRYKRGKKLEVVRKSRAEKATQSECDLTERVLELEQNLKDWCKRAVSAELELAALRYTPSAPAPSTPPSKTHTPGNTFRTSLTNLSFRRSAPDPPPVTDADDPYGIYNVSRISIPEWETRAGDTIFYCIMVETPVQAWKLWKRFTSFCELKESLTELGVALSSFPTRYAFKASIESRRNALENWLASTVKTALGEHSTAKCLIAEFLTPEYEKVRWGMPFNDLHTMLSPFQPAMPGS
eukprot:TRINITY_DN11260_c0_g1_i1.p1 TRINITY_DN11260_c0_g1~~TRINITY_DN11260_c0_g1_i1.p1  ORF type:complete len:405 (+),score=91.77 TRINITY_DN11260_c0_g1_i1:97-1215(+)